jgi:hypothetical protein
MTTISSSPSSPLSPEEFSRVAEDAKQKANLLLDSFKELINKNDKLEQRVSYLETQLLSLYIKFGVSNTDD